MKVVLLYGECGMRCNSQPALSTRRRRTVIPFALGACLDAWSIESLDPGAPR